MPSFDSTPEPGKNTYEVRLARDTAIVLGCCPRSDQLCTYCAEDLFACLRGTAANRGDRWARVIAMRCPDRCREPWPVTAKSRAMAVERVADLSRDPNLRDQLAEELLRYAARAWREVAPA